VRQCKSLGYDYAVKDTRFNDIPLATASSSAVNSWINRTYQWASLGADAPIPENLGYPMNLAAATNLPAVWRIDGEGDPIPHDREPTRRVAFIPPKPSLQRKVVAAVADTIVASAVAHPAQAVLGTAESTKDPTWVKEQFDHLGDLVKDGKMTQWSLSVVVEK
jgi:hypothetical protein